MLCLPIQMPYFRLKSFAGEEQVPLTTCRDQDRHPEGCLLLENREGQMFEVEKRLSKISEEWNCMEFGGNVCCLRGLEHRLCCMYVDAVGLEGGGSSHQREVGADPEDQSPGQAGATADHSSVFPVSLSSSFSSSSLFPLCLFFLFSFSFPSFPSSLVLSIPPFLLFFSPSFL